MLRAGETQANHLQQLQTLGEVVSALFKGDDKGASGDGKAITTNKDAMAAFAGMGMAVG